MTKPTPIRNEDNTHLAGSIGAGKVDVPTPSAIPQGNSVERFSPDPEATTFDAKVLSLYSKMQHKLAPATPEEEVMITELESVVERQTLGENVTLFGDGGPHSDTSRTVVGRLPFQRYTSFKPETLTLVDNLFKARPSSLSQEARAELYQQFINDASAIYEMSTVPRIDWNTGARRVEYNADDNEIKLNPEKPHIYKLLHGFRLAQLSLGNADVLSSLREPFREVNNNYEEYICGCYETMTSLNVGDSCPYCHTSVRAVIEVDTYNLPESRLWRERNSDSRAWSESLYYTSRPVLFEKNARAGGLGTHARSYFLSESDTA